MDINFKTKRKITKIELLKESSTLQFQINRLDDKIDLLYDKIKELGIEIPVKTKNEIANIEEEIYSDYIHIFKNNIQNDELIIKLLEGFLRKPVLTKFKITKIADTFPGIFLFPFKKIKELSQKKSSETEVISSSISINDTNEQFSTVEHEKENSTFLVDKDTYDDNASITLKTTTVYSAERTDEIPLRKELEDLPGQTIIMPDASPKDQQKSIVINKKPVIKKVLIAFLIIFFIILIGAFFYNNIHHYLFNKIFSTTSNDDKKIKDIIPVGKETVLIDCIKNGNFKDNKLDRTINEINKHLKNSAYCCFKNREIVIESRLFQKWKNNHFPFIQCVAKNIPDGYQLVIIGHANRTGLEKDMLIQETKTGNRKIIAGNYTYSKKRAESVLKELEDTIQEISHNKKVIYYGVGSTFPRERISPQAEINRRITFKIIKAESSIQEKKLWEEKNKTIYIKK